MTEIKKVLFIVQSEMTWNCFSSLYHELFNNPIYEPIVVVIPQLFNDDVHKENLLEFTTINSENVLLKEDIPYINLMTIDKPELRLSYLIDLNPEYVFISSKDDWFIRDIFGTDCKNMSSHFKIVYIPYYGATVVEVDNLHTKAKGVLSYWKIIVDSPLYRDLFLKDNINSESRLIDVGHPKIEEIYKIRKITGKWPIENSDNKLKVIWAPHWSCPEFSDWGVIGKTKNEMNLGSFWKNFWHFYDYAKAHQDTVQFVFRPHPLLLFHSKMHGYYEKYVDFFEKWSALPNTYSQLSGLYNETFAASDVLITEGVSFLIEYPIATEKPLIMIKADNGCTFNEIGKLAQEYANVVTSFDEIREFLDNPSTLKMGDATPMLDYLIPYRENTSKKIISVIETELMKAKQNENTCVSST